MEQLKLLLPYTYTSRVAEDVKLVVKLLLSECTATDTVGTTPNPDYLHDLRCISQQGGLSFDDVLRGVFEQLTAHFGIAATGGEADESDEEEDTQQSGQPPTNQQGP